MTLKEQIQSTSKFHRLFQCLIAILANHRAGIKIDSDFVPNLIFKTEGGVVVNKKEIVISSNNGCRISCYDDYHYKERKESEITEKVIINLLEGINWADSENIKKLIEEYFLSQGIEISNDDLYGMISKFCSNPFGDPLRSFYGDWSIPC